MLQKSTHKILIVILLIGSIQALYAQNSEVVVNRNKGWYWGINSGVNVFWGDIRFDSIWPSTEMQEIQAGGGFVFGRTISPTLNLSTELSYTSLRGQKEILLDTLGFRTQALNFALKWQVNLVALFGRKDAKLAFYIESGGGILVWKTLLQNLNTGDTINNLGWTNSNNEFGFYIPAGIKLQYRVSSKFSTYFTSSYNIVFSDLLDGNLTAGKYDSYSYSAFGINYHFGKQKTIPKLLPYAYFELKYDSLTTHSSSREKKSDTIEELDIEGNPFSIDYTIPETVPHTGFDIDIKIVKSGIPSSGFFRLIVPAGFLPQATTNGDVSFTKLGHRYEYDFILPMNQDSTNIPIQIKLNEIEKGTFPILIEGEIIDHKGNIFPIKFATYTEIISEDDWYQGLPIKKQKEFDAKKLSEIGDESAVPKFTNQIIQKTVKEFTQNNTAESQKQMESKVGVYRIQIMASRKQQPDLSAFKAQHKITKEVFVAQGNNWYRYNLYSTKDKDEANRLCTKVRSENKIPQAFVVHYENGKRILSGQTSISSKQKTIQKPSISTKTKVPQGNRILKNKTLYRIEIAIAYEQPIPLYLLNNKVGQERITEFKQNNTYYYTVGEFEDLVVARAFLEYVKSQFKLENANLGQYQKDQRIKGIF